MRDGIDAAIARGLAYAPYADLLWCETSTPDLAEAEQFADAIHERVPGQAARLQLLAVVQLAQAPRATPQIAAFQRDLAALGYRFQFITLAGFHSLNLSMFELARGYRDEAMTAYVRLQEREFELEDEGYTATRHQREVGAGYFDQVLETITGGTGSTLALKGSTEEEQFETETRTAILRTERSAAGARTGPSVTQTPLSWRAVSHDVLEARPPEVSAELAAEIARRVFGVDGKADPLEGERDRNFRIDRRPLVRAQGRQLGRPRRGRRDAGSGDGARAAGRRVSADRATLPHD